MNEYPTPILDFVTECFNQEFESQFSYMRKSNFVEFEKLFMDFRDNFVDANLVKFFHKDFIGQISKLFNNRTHDGLTVSDRVFVIFMENFTNATLTKMKLHYGESQEEIVYDCAADAVACTLSEQFQKSVPFYDERFVDEIAINKVEIKQMLLSVPMLCFYYLVLINLTNTELFRTNLLFADKIASKRR